MVERELGSPMILRRSLFAVPFRFAALGRGRRFRQGAHGAQGQQNCKPEQKTARAAAASARSLGGIAGGVLGGRVGGVAVGDAGLPVGSLLGDAIVNLLDCREQQKAAAATEEAVARRQSARPSTWKSETRPGVTGSSTVTAVES